MGAFDDFFHHRDTRRDNYLSRLFGLFSEKVVHAWCADENAPYEDLGRPILREAEESSWSVLDFTLRRRSSGKTYAAEMKCELAFEKYRYLTLIDSNQLGHHMTSVAFAKILALANGSKVFDVRCQGKPVVVDGAILVWGAVTPEGRDTVIRTYGFADVLSVESMVSDLQTWRPSGWADLIDCHRGWSVELFDFLAGPMTPAAPATANEEGNR